MPQSAAKALVRAYFYQEFLPTVLPQQLLRGGNYLVLLGADPTESRLLTRAGVPAHRVYSVERDLEVFGRQSRLVRQGEMQASLYYGRLHEFISHYLHTNQRFQVLNLDIIGTYKTQIDPVMTEILQFARRNPRTVIATYSNAGRDRAQLIEGIKSLVLFLWIQSELTLTTADTLYGRYQTAGLTPEVSFNMVLRHMFWLRSHLERILCGGVATETVRPGVAIDLLKAFKEVWRPVREQFGPAVTMQELIGATMEYGRLVGVPLETRFDLGFQSVTIATYKSNAHLYHTGWFSLYKRIKPMRIDRWVCDALNVLTTDPLVFARPEGQSVERISVSGGTILPDQVIWRRGGLNIPGRIIRLPVPMPMMALLADVPAPVIKPPVKPVSIRRIRSGKLAGNTKPRRRTRNLRPLTARQIQLIRAIASEQPQATTTQVIETLRLYQHDRQSVTAHIAVGRRRKPAAGN